MFFKCWKKRTVNPKSYIYQKYPSEIKGKSRHILRWKKSKRLSCQQTYPQGMTKGRLHQGECQVGFEEKGTLWLEMVTWPANQKMEQSQPQSRLPWALLAMMLVGALGRNKGITIKILPWALLCLSQLFWLFRSKFSHSVTSVIERDTWVRWVSGEDSSLSSNFHQLFRCVWVVYEHSFLPHPWAMPPSTPLGME